MRRSAPSRRIRRWLVAGLSLVGLGVALLQEVLAPQSAMGTEGTESAAAAEEGLSDLDALNVALTSSRAACEAALPAHHSHERAVATWNLRWFPFGTAPEHADSDHESDIRWMACVMAHLQADIIAVQEVLNNDAAQAAQKRLLSRLDELTGGRHRIVLDECAADSQHVGFIYNAKRVQLLEEHVEASLNPGGSACRFRLRPGVSGRFRFLEADDVIDELTIIAVHFDSGVTGRDHGNRLRSLQALRELTANADQQTLAIGDFNTMGSKGKSNSAQESAQEERDKLESRSGLTRLVPQQPCTHYQRGHASELDHALVTASLGRKAHLTTWGPCAARQCQTLGKAFSAFSEHVSDHCPLRVALTN